MLRRRPEFFRRWFLRRCFEPQIPDHKKGIERVNPAPFSYSSILTVPRKYITSKGSLSLWQIGEVVANGKSYKIEQLVNRWSEDERNRNEKEKNGTENTNTAAAMQYTTTESWRVASNLCKLKNWHRIWQVMWFVKGAGCGLSRFLQTFLFYALACIK